MVRNVIRALDPERPQSTPALEPMVDLNRTRLEMVLKVLDVDGAVRRVKGGWMGTGEDWSYDEERYRTLDEARRRNSRPCSTTRTPRNAEWCSCAANSTTRSSATASGADAATTARASGTTPRWRRRRPSPHGRSCCARGGDHPAPAVADRAEQARAHAVRPDHRRAGRRPGDRPADRSGLGARLRRLLDEPDQTVPDDVVRAAVDVLAAWDWADPAGRGDRARLGGHPTADRLAASSGWPQLGRLTDLGTLRYAPQRRPVTAANSAYRVAALHDSWESPDPRR